ncbi:MAG TPA: ribonuclease H-like domain-containing protein [Trueperaceae bacterium]
MGSLVLDIETKRSFAEVGGARNRGKLGVSVVGTYHYDTDLFIAYREDRFDELAHVLEQADAVIGFNLIGFDWPVLASELGDWVRQLPTVDLMVEAQKALGHRVSLQRLAQATLGAGKLGNGLDALEYYRQGDWERLERYCLEDVKLTRDLYEFAKKHGHLLVQKGQHNAMVPMSFAASPYAAIFMEAQRARGSVRMIYGAKERLVDVYAFDGVYIKGYCHLRGEQLTFRLDRVEKAEAAPSSTPLF